MPFAAPAMTGWVDDSSVWPQGIYEWREVIAFAASIVFSYLTGMLLGRLSLSKKSKTLSYQPSHPLLSSVLTGLGDEHVPAATLQVISKKINEVFTAIVAIATTIMAIYTGLKGLL